MSLLSSGYWSSGTTAGVWYANWNNNRTNSNNNIGFRLDYGSNLKPQSEDSGATGICHPALREICKPPLFGRATENQGQSERGT